MREYGSPALLAFLEATLGDTQATIAHCREAIRQRDPAFVISARTHMAASLRALLEARRLLASIGLPGVPLHADD